MANHLRHIQLASEYESGCRPMFVNREQGGSVLAQRLMPLAKEKPIVLGLPRGGVPVAVEVARALGTQVDVLVVRKMGVPGNPEFGFGAVGEGGVAVVDHDLVARLGLDERTTDRIQSAEEFEVDRRVAKYRVGHPAPDLGGRTVIVVDDGIATGATVRTAVELVRKRGARRIIVAAPVGAPSAVRMLGEVADEVVVVEQPSAFRAVGQHYEDFEQVTDDQVTDALAVAQRELPEKPEKTAASVDTEVQIPAGSVQLPGRLVIPAQAVGVVLFAHGSGSSRFSPRNVEVADYLHRRGIGTLLFDLLTDEEAAVRANVFDIGLLAERLSTAAKWVSRVPEVRSEGLPLGYFGASTGGGAALLAAAQDPEFVQAVVSRGGRPDLAGAMLPNVTVPTLLIVGGHDYQVLELNRAAANVMTCLVEMVVVPGATHLFEEPGAMLQVCEAAGDWFLGTLKT